LGKENSQKRRILRELPSNEFKISGFPEKEMKEILKKRLDKPSEKWYNE